MTKKEVVLDGFGGKRLDFALSELFPEYSRTMIQEWIKGGHVLLEGKRAKASQKVEEGQKVLLEVPKAKEAELVPQDLRVPLLYEDGDLVVVNKPRGLVVHPAAGHWDGTLVNSLLAQCKDLSGIGGEIRPGIVHRLDKDTTGVLVVAKNDFAHQHLAEQIRSRTAQRIYLAIVQGEIDETKGRIVAPIGRHPKDRKKMAVLSQGGKDAVTEFTVLERFKGYTLVECRLITGRTHQIRVHFSYIGYPVMGDPLYGTRKQEFVIEGQALHAQKLLIEQPRSGEKILCEAPLPSDMEEILKQLRTQEGKNDDIISG